jgi:hypothetical protein
MEFPLTCRVCKKHDIYDKSELTNIGTFLDVVWAVRCHYCSNIIKQGKLKLKIPKNKELHLERHIEDYEGSYSITFIPKETKSSKLQAKKQRILLEAYKRAKKSDIREQWIQDYIKSHFQEFGFSKISMNEGGPDFDAIEKGKVISVEAERDWKSYIKHKHHKDKRFNKVKYMIVLTPQKPPKEMIRALPKILFIEHDKFVPWWCKTAKKYAERHENLREKDVKSMRIYTPVIIIANAFRRIYHLQCDDKDRDMAICLDCDNCPYLDESTDFNSLAIKFIIQYKYPIYSDNFKITDINAKELEKFYIKAINT